MSERRGTIRFEADGKDYAIRFGTNQIVGIEEAFGKTFREVTESMQGGDIQMKDFRSFFAIAAGLPDDEAGDVIDEIGHDRVGELLGQSLQASFPAPKKGAAGNVKRRTRT
ncbi:MAG: hypothetical protein ACK46Q_05665 [Hyphomonas sp.]